MPKETAPHGPQLEHAHDFSHEGKGFFARTRDRIKESAERKALEVLTKTRAATVDRFNIKVQDTLLNYHDWRSGKVVARRELVTDQRKALEVELAGLQTNLNTIQQGGLEVGSVHLQAKLAKERDNIERRMESLKNKEDSLNTKISYRNQKKEAYDTTRKEIANGVVERISDRMEPHAEKLERVQDKKDQLDTEVAKFVDIRNKLQAEYDTLKKQNAKTVYRYERMINHPKLKQLESQLKESKLILSSRMQHRAEVEHKLAGVAKRVDKWNDRRNKFARVTQRKVDYVETPPSIVEPVRLTNSGKENPSNAPEQNNTFTNNVVSPKSSVGHSVESRREVKSKKVEEYIADWNSQFASIAYIDKEPFERFVSQLPKKLKGSSKVSLDNFSATAKMYFEFMRTQNVVRKTKQKTINNAMEFFVKIQKTLES